MPVVRLTGDLAVGFITEAAMKLTKMADYSLEYPWSEWSEWEAGEWKDTGGRELVAVRQVATSVTLFKVLEYVEQRDYRIQQQRVVARMRRNAAGECEVERNIETRWADA
jgi:hypothetical protein